MASPIAILASPDWDGDPAVQMLANREAVVYRPNLEHMQDIGDGAKADHRFIRTLEEVFAKPEFGDTVLRICQSAMKQFLDRSEIIHIKVGAGYQVASCIAKAVEMVLNSLVDLYGERLFVCQLYKLWQVLEVRSRMSRLELRHP